MIYLRTGANGAGKTLLTLRDVREKSLAESRPVYYNGRFEMVADFGWTKIDAKDWESVPDGAIFLFDECHNDFPVRSGTKDAVPQYVRQLAEHRRRGFDFFLITQHPMNLDAFVRRLIGAPGWHQHLKRASGAPLVSVIQWDAVNDQPQKAGSGASGQVKMVPYPKEVYSWYVSTSLDTAKIRIPFQVKLLVVSLVAIPLLGYFGYKTLMDRVPGKPAAGQPGAKPAGAVPGGQSEPRKVMTTAEYVNSFQPRIPGFAFSAPRYDDATKPVNVPYPAACIQSKSKGCQCYSQQATKLDVPLSLCVQIVAGGFFNDWQQAVTQAQAGRSVEPVPVAVPVTLAAADPVAYPHPMSAKGTAPVPVDQQVQTQTQRPGHFVAIVPKPPAAAVSAPR